MKPTPSSSHVPDWTTPRPITGSYWVVPGRLLVGEHPGSRSRAQSMERLRRFLEAGVTCFVDLTLPDETPAYDNLLPFETPAGRRVEYLREPIADHGVPADRETMARIVAMLDGALGADHIVYLHCRAGIGRSAMAAGCWLAERVPGGGRAALDQLAGYWRQAAQSRTWPDIPETAEQAEFVRTWQPLHPVFAPVGDAGAIAATPVTGELAWMAQRVRGAWHGLALADALGGTAAADGAAASRSLAWTQHTAMALCLAESLFTLHRCDARDQIERYWRWFKEGHHSATDEPGELHASADVAKALATYRWRGLPMAGSHDPQVNVATSLPRVLAAALYAGREPAAAIALAAECSRTTHQSPLALDCCRLLAAMIVCALHGQPASQWLQGIPEPAPQCWGAKPLRRDVRSAAESGEPRSGSKGPGVGDAIHVLMSARRVVAGAATFDAAIAEARRSAGDHAALVTALTGMLFGLLHGIDALPAAQLARLARREAIEAVASQCLARLAATGGKA